jgi:hypothetical protein
MDLHPYDTECHDNGHRSYSFLINVWISCVNAYQIFDAHDQFYNISRFCHDKGIQYLIVQI